jgi:hypothetical protein
LTVLNTQSSLLFFLVVQLNTIIPLDVSYDYEYVDESLANTVEIPSKEKIPSKFKSEMEFTLSSDLDGILCDRKSELMELLKADQDDLMVIHALKKTSCSNASGNSNRTRGQGPANTIDNNAETMGDSKETEDYAKSQQSQSNELRQMIADWESGLITNEEIDIHLVEIMAYLVRMTGSQVRFFSFFSLS